MPRPAPGPRERTLLLVRSSLGPRVAPARARRLGTHPADQMTTCEVHAARSNEIKPLNLVDQWSRGCGKGLDCFLCLIGHIRGYPPGPIAAEFRLLPSGAPAMQSIGGQEMTRRASGTEPKVTYSPSPTYSPSTWNAIGRVARTTSWRSSCKLRMCLGSACPPCPVPSM